MSESALPDAVQVLVGRADRRWVEVAGSVLDAVSRATRRSLPVAVASQDAGRTFLSEQVMTARLRRAVAGAVQDAAPARVRLRIDRDDHLVGVLVEVVVRYGAALIPLADHVRRAVSAETASWGTSGSQVAVAVEAAHVHVGDVVVGDPRLADPADG